jgi:hypothetical protein
MTSAIGIASVGGQGPSEFHCRIPSAFQIACKLPMRALRGYGFPRGGITSRMLALKAWGKTGDAERANQPKAAACCVGLKRLMIANETFGAPTSHPQRIGKLRSMCAGQPIANLPR